MNALKNCAAFLLLFMMLFSSRGTAQQGPPLAIVSSLMERALADYPGREAVMLTVTYPPGAVDPVHRHNAHAFVYVLEGSIVMGVQGSKSVTLVPGETFYEGPNDLHTIGRNASSTEPAKFLVLLIKARGEPVAIPAEK